MGQSYSAPTLSLVNTVELINPAVSTIDQLATASFGRKRTEDVLIQTSFQSTGEESISFIRDVNEVFKGEHAEFTKLTNEVAWPNHAEFVEEGHIRGLEGAHVIAANGFFPRKDKNGDISIYNGNGERTILTAPTVDENGVALNWFYHVTKFADMNGNGRMDIVTARTFVPYVPAGPPGVTRPGVENAETQLLWLEQPEDGIASGQPWTEHIIQEDGPGVYIDLVDMDKNGKTQILTSEFFTGLKVAILDCPKDHWADCTSEDIQTVIVDQDPNNEGPALPPCSVVPAGTPCADGGAPPPSLPQCSVVPAGTPCAGPPCSVVPAGTPCSPDGGEGSSPPSLPLCGTVPSGTPCAGPPCYVVPPGVPCDDTIPAPQPQRYFSAKFTDLNADGVDDILATSSPHVKGGEGKVWAYERPSNWRTGKWEAHILSEGAQYAIDSPFANGSPGLAQSFYMRNRGMGKPKYPSIILSGDDAGFAATLTPVEPTGDAKFEWKYDFKPITTVKSGKGTTVGSPAISYDCEGYAQFAIPMYSDDTVEFFSYNPKCPWWNLKC